MASGALFGGSAARSSSKNLVEFRAGKMTLKGKMVHPDKRKGMVYVYQSDDSLMHFCWKDRTKGTVEDDLIIFPDDIEFKHVPQCTTGRVYLLKFKSSSRKFFFWMQEPKTDKDEEHRRKVNDLLNNPPTPGSSRGGSGGFSGIPPDLASGGLAEGDLQSLLGNMNQQQLMQLLGGMGMSNMGGLSQLIGGRPSSSQSESTSSSRVQSSPGPRVTESSSTPAATTAASSTVAAAPLASATTTPAPTVTTASAGSAGGAGGAGGVGGAGGSSGILLSDLQNILGSLGAPADQKEPIDLAVAITPEAMIPLLANSDVQERLMPFLPEGEVLPKTAEELRATVSSPQFRQAMSSFSAALASGQLGPLMPQFGLGEDVANAAAQGDVEAFVKAMQAAQAKKEDSKDEKKD